MRRIKAADVMSWPVVTVTPEATLGEAASVMRAHGISGLPVVDERGRLIGIVTESDIVLEEAGPGGMLQLVAMAETPRADEPRSRTTVADVMTTEVITATEHDPVRAVACCMHQHDINRVPIVRDAGIVGIVTRADVVAVFDRPDEEVVEDVRAIIADELLLDPEGFEIGVRDGVVAISGPVDDHRDVRLIKAFLGQLDGISGVDTSGLRASVNA